MNEGETNRQPHEENEQLRREIELLKAKIIELEARLAQYENAHTPPSLRRGRNRKKDQDKNDKGNPGQKIGHKGVTRLYTTPDRQVQVTMDRCPDCGCPHDGKFGNNIIAQATLPKYEYRLTHRKIKDAMISEYDAILNKS